MGSSLERVVERLAKRAYKRALERLPEELSWAKSHTWDKISEEQKTKWRNEARAYLQDLQYEDELPKDFEVRYKA